jgi:hypothetical protein
MAQNKSSQGRIPDWAGTSGYYNAVSGVKFDPGPFIGIIKNNADPARAGRLAVWVPAIGGDESDADKWFIVRYASPFFGSTLGLNGDDTKNFNVSQQTYGFWAVPPDIGNHVLITFVMGDPNQGFWFACVPNLPTTGMVPAIARPDGENIGTTKINEDPLFGSGRISSDSYLPTSELVAQNQKSDTDPKFFELPKVVHTYQANIVLEQGLDKDPIRGTVTSSSQRETPSQVIGLSSPGRSIPDTAEFPNLETLLKEDRLKVATVQQFPNRKGGHSLVMDDGDIFGKSRLTRLRSSGGHQILMHDTENIMYISNSLGTSWVELTPDGSINIFSNSNVSIRAQQDLNFHADNNINIHSGNELKIFAAKQFINETQSYQLSADKNISMNAGNIGLKSGTTLLMEAVTGGWKTSGDIVLKGRNIYLNTYDPELPLTNQPLEFYKQANVSYNTDKKLWESSDETFESLSPYTPTHEPWTRQSGQLKKNDGTVVEPSPQTPGSTT